jgi:hypothetical protein
MVVCNKAVTRVAEDPEYLSRIRNFFMPDPDPNLFHPGSQICIKHLFLNYRKYDLGCSSRIRTLDPDPDFYPSRIPGSKGTGSRIRIRNTDTDYNVFPRSPSSGLINGTLVTPNSGEVQEAEGRMRAGRWAFPQTFWWRGRRGTATPGTPYLSMIASRGSVYPDPAFLRIRIQYFALMQIRIRILIKVMEICDQWSMTP